MPDPTATPGPPAGHSTGHPGGTGNTNFATTTIHDGRVIVASDALLAQLDSLGRLAQNVRLAAGALLGVLDALEPIDSIGYAVPLAAREARRLIHAAVGILLGVQDRAQHTASGVVACLTTYAEVERDARAVVHRVDENGAWWLGVGARVLSVPLLVIAGGGLFATAVSTGRSPSELALGLQDFLKRHGRILTNAGTVAVIRELASDADGFGAGFSMVPQPVAAALDATGLTGVRSSANSVVATGRAVGLFKPTGVTVKKTSSFEFGAPPTSLVARSESFPIPEADPNGEQIRIDRYVEAGKPDRFDVFIAGTVTFDPKTSTQPFDFTSDLNGVGGQSSASYDAVVSAMRQAGVTPNSPVVLNGYSQGGLLASQVAASHEFNVHGVVTFGAPSAQVAVPASIPVLTVRNAEDLVPATSGYDINPNAVVVERPVFASRPVPSDWAVPAHRLSYYQETAAVIDQAHSSEVRGVLDPLNHFAAGATRVDSSLWVASRVPEVTCAAN